MIKLNPPHRFNNPEVIKEFAEILDSGIYTNNGPKVKQLERMLEQFSSALVNVVSNGTIAMQMSIKALGLNGDIITTPFSFVSSVSSILWEKCNPVFADIDAETLCLDANKIRAAITENTVAMLPVHIFGNSCDIDAMTEIAEERNLKVIYDAAHAFGTEYNGRSVFQFGDCSALSLHAFKVLSAAEGGAIFCKEREVFNNIFEMRYFGKNIENLDIQLGMNAKMSEFHAALAITSFNHATEELSARKAISNYYRNALSVTNKIRFQKTSPKSEPNHSFFPIVLENEEVLVRLLKSGKEKDIEFRKYFNPSLNKLPYLKKFYPCPISESMENRVLCLPTGSHLTEDDLKKITDVILSVF